MTTFDIREEDNSEITEIVFADPSGKDGFSQANKLIIDEYEGKDYIQFLDEESDNAVYINTKEHAENLIKALRKAIELGWVK